MRGRVCCVCAAEACVCLLCFVLCVCVFCVWRFFSNSALEFKGGLEMYRRCALCLWENPTASLFAPTRAMHPTSHPSAPHPPPRIPSHVPSTVLIPIESIPNPNRPKTKNQNQEPSRSSAKPNHTKSSTKSSVPVPLYARGPYVARVTRGTCVATYRRRPHARHAPRAPRRAHEAPRARSETESYAWL